MSPPPLQIDKQSQEYITDFKDIVDSKIVTRTLQCGLAILTCYILLKLAICRLHIGNIQTDEQKHLSDIGQSELGSKKLLIDSVLAFLDSSHEVVTLPNACTAPAVCQSVLNLLTINFGLLTNSGVDFIFHFINSAIQYPYMKTNLTFLALPPSSPAYQLTYLKTLSPNISNALSNASKTQYLFASFPMEDNSIELICIPIQYSNSLLCVSYTAYLVTTIPNLFIRIQPYFKYSATQIQHIFTPLNAILTPPSQLYDGILEEVALLQKYGASSLSSIQFEAEGNEFLFDPQILRIPSGLLLGEHIFSYNKVSFSREVPFYKGIMESALYSVVLMGVPEAEYAVRVRAAVAAMIAGAEWSVHALLAVAAVLVAWGTVPQHLLRDTLHRAILHTKKLVDLIRNKDLTEFQQLAGHDDSPLLSLVHHFRLFAWALRLKQPQSPPKYKRLLLEGLRLLPPHAFAPVFKFVYSELILLQQSKVKEMQRAQAVADRTKSKHRPRNKKMKERKQSMDSEPKEGKQTPDPTYPRTTALKQKPAKPLQSKMQHFYSLEEDQMMKNICGVRFSKDIKEVDQSFVVKKPSRQICEGEHIMEENAFNSFGTIHSSQTITSHRYPSQYPQVHSWGCRDIGNALQRDNELHEDLEQYKFDGEKDVEEDMPEEMVTIYSRVLDYYNRLLSIVREEEAWSKAESIARSNAILQLRLGRLEVVCEMLTLYSEDQIGSLGWILEEEGEGGEEEGEKEGLLRGETLELVQLTKMRISSLIKMPFSYKALQQLCQSSHSSVRMGARRLYAQECTKIYSHLEMEIIYKCEGCLVGVKSTHEFKRDVLYILIRTFELRPMLRQQVRELALLRQHYNYSNKKYSFVVVGDSLSNTLSFLGRIHSCLTPFDLLQLYAISDDDIKAAPEMTKPHSADHLCALLDSEKRVSVKSLGHKSTYQKMFHEVLTLIEEDQTDFSKYVVIVLGGESHSLSAESEESSSNTSKFDQNKIYQEITRQISKSYFHMIVAAEATVHANSKQARIKRYARLCPSLLEVDIAHIHSPQTIAKMELFLM